MSANTHDMSDQYESRLLRSRFWDIEFAGDRFGHISDIS